MAWRILFPKNLLIVLGDVIDRGNNVAETLTWIMEQSKKKNFIFLAGNHELMMLNAFNFNSVTVQNARISSTLRHVVENILLY